jgi:hypothetical protein
MTTKKEAFAMVCALHKFIFYVNHMMLLYFVQKPQLLGRLMKCLLIFLEYDFSLIYKLERSHSMVDALSRMFDFTKQSGISN